MPAPENIQSAPSLVKVDESENVVFGWAFVCKMNGELHFDLHGDNLDEDYVVPALKQFMLDGGIGKEMHVGDQKGRIVAAWPVTPEIAKAFGDEAPAVTGLRIGIYFDDAAVVAKFKDGTYTGFSIGGSYGETEDLPDA